MSTSLWLEQTPALAPEPAPPPGTAQVCVIGAGVAGVSAALWLARMGVDVVVLEAGAVAGRASGRNDGQVLLGLGEHYNRIVGQLGARDARVLWDYIHENHAALRTELERAGAIESCGFVQAGGLRLAEDAHEWEELQEAAVLLGGEDIPHELLDAGAVGAVLPGARDFRGALRLPGEAIVQPVAMVRALATAARAAGARIHEHTKVVAVDGHEGTFEVRHGDGDVLRAQIVVHCTSALGRGLDASGFLKAQLFAFRGQVIATDLLPEELADRFPPYAMSSHFCYEYFRMHDRRFVAGGMRWSVPGEQLGIVDDGRDEPRITANLIAWVARHFPVLANVPFPRVWTGIMCGTNDALPLVGALPGHPGVFALLGFNGYGLSFAFLAGKSLAEQVVGGRASHDAARLFAPRRFA